MRAAGFALLFSLSMAQIGAPQFEARSRHLLLTIDTKPAPAGVTYDVVVRDLDSGQVLIDQHPQLPVDGEVNLSNEVGELHVTMKIVPKIDRLLAMVTLTRNGDTVDQLAARWRYTPPRVPQTVPPSLFQGHLFHVGGDVKPPILIHRVDPVYPEVPRKARISGVVILAAVVDKSGTVRQVSVLKPLPFGLDQAAADAVRQWKFRPATRFGRPVDVVFNITVSFEPPDRRQ